MEPEIRKQPVRFYEIDLLRFIAAISVVFYHYTYRGYAEGQYSPLSFPEIGVFTRYGYLGVDLFFIISGYVVLLSAQNKTVRQFFISRVTRLYPAFWVACTLTFLVEYVWGYKAGNSQMSPLLQATPWQYILNMTMLSGFMGVTPVDGVYWSLSVEIRFYIIIALLTLARQMPRINFFLFFWIAYAAVMGPVKSDLLTQFLLPRYAAYFAAGMLFYLMQQSSGRNWFRHSLLLSCYILAIRSALQRTYEQSLLSHIILSQEIVVVIITLFFAVFLLIIYKKINFSKNSWLTWLGILTYPLYLLHQHIGFVIFQRLNGYFNKYLLLTITTILMLGASYLLHVAIEKRFSNLLLKLMDRWLPFGKKVRLSTNV